MTTDVQPKSTEAQGSAPTSFVEEYKLLVDSDGKYKEELFNTFDTYRQQLKMKLQQGCTQEDYTRYTRLLESIDTAVTVIERVWLLVKEQNQIKGESDIFEEAIG
jgi:cell fate (sporulation/competence/biofilm development) regulator YlbF (YheA/YmcA/DUF963 family)